MTLQEHCCEDKLTMIALHSLLGDCAAKHSVSLEGSLSAICCQNGVNRTQVYERRKQLWEAFGEIELAGPGRPAKLVQEIDSVIVPAGYQLREQILRYRLEHPGAMIVHSSGTTSYSDGFRRFLLDRLDLWEGELEAFCHWVEIPYRTLLSWQKRDRREPYCAAPPRALPALPESASEICRDIVQAYAIWEGSLRDFLRIEAQRLHLPPGAIRRVLVISGMLPVKPSKSPRYRGSTKRLTPGEVLVTDGKEIQVVSTATGEISRYNWQGAVDQATACHTAVVITDTECAQGVLEAFEASCQFLGRRPGALLHDNKPIHEEAALREVIEPETRMIAATPGRGENKAVIEGEFGKFEQAVGTIHLDDSSPENLKRSAVHEVIRAYTAGIDQAGRAEFQGKSRLEVVRKSCPDPQKDRAFLEQLQAEHAHRWPAQPLPSRGIARQLLDAGFARFALDSLDPDASLREWLSGRYTPEAIRQGLAIFGTEHAKGRLRNQTAHRYLVKLIQNCQVELDLRSQESWLREFAETERGAWLQALEQDYVLLEAECTNPNTLENDLALRLSEKAVFGSLFLERAFWEERLKALLSKQRQRIGAVCRHLRRLYEAEWNDRFQLISRLVDWELQLAQ